MKPQLEDAEFMKATKSSTTKDLFPANVLSLRLYLSYSFPFPAKNRVYKRLGLFFPKIYEVSSPHLTVCVCVGGGGGEAFFNLRSQERRTY